MAWWGCTNTRPVLLPSMPAFIRRAHTSASLTHTHTHTCVYKRAENFFSSVMPRRRQRKCGRERSAGLVYGIFALPWEEAGGPAAGTGWLCGWPGSASIPADLGNPASLSFSPSARLTLLETPDRPARVRREFGIFFGWLFKRALGSSEGPRCWQKNKGDKPRK